MIARRCCDHVIYVRTCKACRAGHRLRMSQLCAAAEHGLVLEEVFPRGVTEPLTSATERGTPRHAPAPVLQSLPPIDPTEILAEADREMASLGPEMRERWAAEARRAATKVYPERDYFSRLRGPARHREDCHAMCNPTLAAHLCLGVCTCWSQEPAKVLHASASNPTCDDYGCADGSHARACPAHGAEAVEHRS